MGRIARTPEQIRDLIERVIRKDSFFDSVQTGALHLHEPDAQGCNWSIDDFSGPPEIVRECTEAISPLLHELRSLVHVEVRT
jgi:hypothetical protein